MVITSLDNKTIKEINRLKIKKNRDAEGLFLVEGEHLIKEALNAGLLVKTIEKEGFDSDYGVEKIEVTESVMNKITDMDTSCNIVGVVKKKKEEKLGEKILILDGIQDPGNLGTIIRSSKAFNVNTIILSKDSVDLYNPKVIRATQGMMFHINIIRRDLMEVIKEIKDKNIPLYVTRVEDGEDIRNLSDENKKRFALVMGNEGNGVSNNIIEMADKYIYINMNKSVESLNVAVAASILLYELGGLNG